MREDKSKGWMQEKPITIAEAEEYIATTTFVPGSERRIGVEIERFPVDPNDIRRQIPLAQCEEILSQLPSKLPHRSWTATEPGGAVELASRPAPNLGISLTETRSDLAIMDDLFERHGLSLAGVGLDPLHHRIVQRNAPRYQTMENMFQRDYGYIPSFMNNSCSVQVNVDCGEDDETWQGMNARFIRLNRLGPLFTAIFANSRYQCGRDTGWRSYRQRNRFITFPEYSWPRDWEDPVNGFVRYALESAVYLLRDDGNAWLNSPGLSMREWIINGSPRPATLDDLRYQISTLFLPVKARGYYELRMIDTPPNPFGVVPGALAFALLEDEKAFDSTSEILDELYHNSDLHEVYLRASRFSVSDSSIFNAAVDVCTHSIAAMDRLGVNEIQMQVVADFLERYTFQGRCPADDMAELGPEAYLQSQTSHTFAPLTRGAQLALAG